MNITLGKYFLIKITARTNLLSKFDFFFGDLEEIFLRTKKRNKSMSYTFFFVKKLPPTEIKD